MTRFLQDEVRSGFYIPTAIKQAWAVQLKILSEIDRICSKYNIRYFADWGTYLGAVRHGGFVPWDDDLDICMLREDYERFKQVAKSELPTGYAVHNFETKENHWLFLARVVNTDSICFDKKHLDENYNFPYIATVDIFILDYLYEDEEEERKRCDEVKHIIALADGIVQGTLRIDAAAEMLTNLEEKYGLKPGSIYTNKCNKKTESRKIGIALYYLAEAQMGRTPKEKSNRIGQIFPWVLKGGRGLPKEYYDRSIRLPFEFTTIPVPAYYHKGLEGRYGEYMRVHKIWGGHDYPYFEKQRANLQAVADFKLPEFTFKPELLRENQPSIDKSGSLKALTKECLSELESIVARVCNDFINTGVLEDLANCQQLAVDLGTLIEEVKGENREGTVAVVKSLEAFCETVYGLYMYVQDVLSGEEGLTEKINGLEDSFEIVKENTYKYVINRKEVLFVCTVGNHLYGFKNMYDSVVADEDTDVYVVKVPVMRKDAYGNIITQTKTLRSAVDSNVTEEQGEVSGDSECINKFVTDWKSYSLELHMPDEIFIQDVYDRENPCLTIPEMYYAENLQRYTDKLVFVPPFLVNEFKREDSTDWYNMKHYVTAPGVVSADVIMVQSENMKKNYVEKLTEFAGEKTWDIWDKKVVVAGAAEGSGRTDGVCVTKGGLQDTKAVADNRKKNKRIMYCIGLNEMLEHREDIIEKLQKRLEIMAQHSDDIDVVVCMYPYDESVWINVVPEMTEILFDTVRKYESEKFQFIHRQEGREMEDMRDILNICDAYYGSPTPYAHYFNAKGKPVMLCDYSF